MPEALEVAEYESTMVTCVCKCLIRVDGMRLCICSENTSNTQTRHLNSLTKSQTDTKELKDIVTPNLALE